MHFQPWKLHRGRKIQSDILWTPNRRFLNIDDCDKLSRWLGTNVALRILVIGMWRMYRLRNNADNVYVKPKQTAKR